MNFITLYYIKLQMNTGYIYKICCNDINITDLYIGSCKALRQRKSCHKSACLNENSDRYNYILYQCIRKNGGWNNWSMIIIEEVKYNNKYELHSRERFHLEQLHGTLNITIPTHSNIEWQNENKEYMKKWRKNYNEENKISIKEKNKQYHINNKEKLSDKHKEYYLKNINTIKEKSKELRIKKANILHQKINCNCGGKYTYAHITTHQKTKIHTKYISLLSNTESHVDSPL